MSRREFVLLIVVGFGLTVPWMVGVYAVALSSPQGRGNVAVMGVGLVVYAFVWALLRPLLRTGWRRLRNFRSTPTPSEEP